MGSVHALEGVLSLLFQPPPSLPSTPPSLPLSLPPSLPLPPPYPLGYYYNDCSFSYVGFTNGNKYEESLSFNEPNYNIEISRNPGPEQVRTENPFQSIAGSKEVTQRF